MLLHRVRIGLGLEEDVLAPNPFATPCAKTPAPNATAMPSTPFPPLPPLVAQSEVVDKTVEEMNVAGDAERVKEELLDEAQIASAAEKVSLFELQLLGEGIIEIDSSSGSGSSSDSSSESSHGPAVAKPDVNAFLEEVPEGMDFYKHRKSSIVHRVKSGSKIAGCGAVMSVRCLEFSQCVGQSV